MPFSPTPRAGLVTALGSEANDFAARMHELALGADEAFAVATHAAFTDRPAAGVIDRLFWATDRKALFYDDGTRWWTIYSQFWSAWNPIISAYTGADYLITVNSTAVNEFKVVGDTCWINYIATWTLTGPTNPSPVGATMTLPVEAHALDLPMRADIQNGPGRALIQPSVDKLLLLPGNSLWAVDGVPKAIRIAGEFRVSSPA